MVLFTFQLPSSQAISSIFTFHSVSHVRRFLFFAGSHRRAYPQDFWDVLHQRLQHVRRGGIKPQEIRGCGQLTRDNKGILWSWQHLLLAKLSQTQKQFQ